MGYREDAINAVRRTIIPQLHYLFKSSFDGYAVSHTTADEYALTAHCSEATIEEILERLGFSRNPIASLKVRMDGNTAEGSWVWRESPLADNQLHIVLHELEDAEKVDVYAHWECSWIRHPYKHYVARGYDAQKGVELARRWLVDAGDERLNGSSGIEYEIDDSLSRRASQYLSVSYYQVEERLTALRSRLPVLGGNKNQIIDRDGERDAVSPTITDEF
ncbi:hypothetical protein [Natronorubrum bangense]|uniref:Uncharacterized protein n=2 Tax=Natronorubrum bangense TaxID=61858 RepID=L9WQR0_9EURY|nr:hypothetical protein [Natronorubrum bangense]ELY51830.1 hypothetical protein C494_01806 [Natronorubrum bangense JCM 10635]QCC54939.1 hypothetical protein DV706_10950 [Natronorubrum bangense]